MRKLPVLDGDALDEDYPDCWGKLFDRLDPACRQCLCFSSCGEESTGAKVDPLDKYRGTVQQVPALRVPPPAVPQVTPTLGETTRLFPSAAVQVQQVLSVPEPMGPDESPWNFLGRALIRGMGKSIGMTIANFFDQTPLRALFFRKK